MVMGKVKLWFWCWQISHRGTDRAGTSLLGWSQHTERSNWAQWYSWEFLMAGGRTNWASSSLIWRLQSSPQSLLFITIQQKVANLKWFYKASSHCEVTLLKNISYAPGWTTDKASLHQGQPAKPVKSRATFQLEQQIELFCTFELHLLQPCSESLSAPTFTHCRSSNSPSVVSFIS